MAQTAVPVIRRGANGQIHNAEFVVGAHNGPGIGITGVFP